jgi:hypothetical protein
MSSHESIARRRARQRPALYRVPPSGGTVGDACVGGASKKLAQQKKLASGLRNE